MCTVCFKRLGDRLLLAKTRDRSNEEVEKLANSLVRDEDVVLVTDDHFGGAWAAINRHGVAIAHTLGPFREETEHYDGSMENFGLNEDVIREAKSAQEAVEMYVKGFESQNIGKSYGVLILDLDEGFYLELAQGEMPSVSNVDGEFCITNVFDYKEHHNGNDRLRAKSKARREFIDSHLSSAETPEDLIGLLQHHGEGLDSVCRHGGSDSRTVGSLVASVRRNDNPGVDVNLWYSLDLLPCEREYEHVAISFD